MSLKALVGFRREQFQGGNLDDLLHPIGVKRQAGESDFELRKRTFLQVHDYCVGQTGRAGKFTAAQVLIGKPKEEWNPVESQLFMICVMMSDNAEDHKKFADGFRFDPADN